MNLSLMQNTYCTGTSPNDKLAFLRHAIVTYYIFDYHTHFEKFDLEDQTTQLTANTITQPGCSFEKQQIRNGKIEKRKT